MGGPPKDPFISAPLQVGKYLVSPLTQIDDAGRYRASVSIRSGRGSMTHDRVLRFVPRFDSSDQAAQFAAEQALVWIDQAARTPCHTQPEYTPWPRKN